MLGLADRGEALEVSDVRSSPLFAIAGYGQSITHHGVPLCWHHHRTLDEGIWHIRMRHGTPEIRGPGWWDPYAKWRSPHLGYQAIDDALDAEHSREQAQEPAWNTW